MYINSNNNNNHIIFICICVRACVCVCVQLTFPPHKQIKETPEGLLHIIRYQNNTTTIKPGPVNTTYLSVYMVDGEVQSLRTRCPHIVNGMYHIAGVRLYFRP